MTRSTIGYASRFIDGPTLAEQQLFKWGENGTRWQQVMDSDGRVLWGTGTLLEPSVENKNPRSEQFSVWSMVRAAVSADTELGPDGISTVEKLVGTAVDNTHGVGVVVTLTAAAYVCSYFVKAGSVDWCYLRNLTGGQRAWFDLSNGETGATTSCTSGIMGPYHNDFYRCWYSFTGTAAGHSLWVHGAEGNSDTTYLPNGTETNIYLWGAQVELGEHPSSYIPTGASAVTRVADGIVRHANPYPDARQGSLAFEVWLPDHTPSSYTAILELNDGGDSFITLMTEASTGKLMVESSEGGSSVVDKVITDGKVHTLFVSWKPSGLVAWVDDVPGTYDDTDVDVPAGLENVDLKPCGGVIGEIRNLWPVFSRTPWSVDHRRPLVIMGGY